MKSRLDRTLDIMLVVLLAALIAGHLMNWGRPRFSDAPVFDYEPMTRPEQRI